MKLEEEEICQDSDCKRDRYLSKQHKDGSRDWWCDVHWKEKYHQPAWHRLDAAKWALQGLLANPRNNYVSVEQATEAAVEAADSLLAKLKIPRNP